VSLVYIDVTEKNIKIVKYYGNAKNDLRKLFADVGRRHIDMNNDFEYA